MTVSNYMQFQIISIMPVAFREYTLNDCGMVMDQWKDKNPLRVIEFSHKQSKCSVTVDCCEIFPNFWCSCSHANMPLEGFGYGIGTGARVFPSKEHAILYALEEILQYVDRSQHAAKYTVTRKFLVDKITYYNRVAPNL